MRLAVLDEPSQACPYLPNREMLNEAYYFVEAGLDERDALLAAGYRSFGKYLFRPQCQMCYQCVPLRIPVQAFKASKSQRRIKNRCAGVELRVGTPVYSDEKLAIYEDHLRRFPNGQRQGSEEHLRFSFYDPDVPALEFCYYVEEHLAAVGIVHTTTQALSSVYFTYRQEYHQLSLGVFSVLCEIEYAMAQGKDFLYLGYYVRENHFMNYKARYHPNEVLTSEGTWVPFFDQHGKCELGTDLDFKPFPVISSSTN